LHLEQYLDFLRDRQFRESLLCRAEARPPSSPQPELLGALCLASPARPSSAQPDVTGPGVEKFEGARETAVRCREPLTKAAFVILAEAWPQALSFAELTRSVTALLSRADGQLTAEETLNLQRFLTQVYATASNRLLELHIRPFPLASKPGARPRASLLARLQVRSQGRATNLRHQSIKMDDFQRRLLGHLDGTNDRAALAKLMSGDAADDELTARIETELRNIAYSGFLVAC
jgi:methyltransferase-like protein